MLPTTTPTIDDRMELMENPDLSISIGQWPFASPDSKEGKCCVQFERSGRVIERLGVFRNPNEAHRAFLSLKEWAKGSMSFGPSSIGDRW